MKIVEELKWRYATKKFDPSRKIAEDSLDYLKESIRLSASSYGLQPYKVLIIADEEIRNALLPVSANQRQVVDASHLFVFCNFTGVSEEYIHDYFSLKAEVQNLDKERLLKSVAGIKSSLDKRSSEELRSWTSKQTYIAMSNLLAACAELQVDACPMEGFNSAEYDKILKLQEKGLEAAALVTVGYRSEDDTYQHLPKVRKSQEDLFVTL